MLKNNTYLKTEFRKLAGTVLITFMVTVFGEFIDYILAGMFLGETAVAAVSLINPLYESYAGIASLISLGFATLYAHSMGEFDKERADQIYCETLLIAVVIGIISCILAIVFADKYVAVYGCTGELLREAKDYYRYFPFVGLIYGLFYVQNYKCESDGDTKLMFIASVSCVVVHIILGVILSKLMGTAGLGLSTLISIVVQVCILNTHMLRKEYKLERFQFYFSFKDFFAIIQHGCFGLISYFLIAIVDIIFNGYIISQFGQELVSTYALVNLIMNTAIIIESIMATCISFTGVYYGERNATGVTNVMKHIFKVTFIFGVVYTMICIFGCKYMPYIYGITSPGVYEMGVFVSCVIGTTAVFIVTSYIPINLYSCLEQPALGTIYAVLFSGVMPLACGLTLGQLFGYKGMVIGLGLANVLTIVGGSIITIIIKGKKGFPLYLDMDDQISFVYTVNRESDKTATALDCIVTDLLRSGITQSQASRIRLVADETVKNIVDSNDDGRILIEISVLVSENKVQLIFRDNGKLMNVFEENEKINSLNTYVLHRLLSGKVTRDYMVTTSSNRNSITIDRE